MVSFASTDPLLVTLHNANITALYVINASGAPPWANPDAEPVSTSALRNAGVICRVLRRRRVAHRFRAPLGNAG